MSKLRSTKLLTLLAVVGLVVVSCTTPSKIYPYHTTVEGIYALEAGMSLSSVEKALGGARPYDIKANFTDGYKVIEYKYMHRFQKVPIQKKNDPEYVSGGKEAFKDESSLHVVFDTNDKLLFYVTDAGKQRAESSLATANDLNMIKMYPELFASKASSSKKAMPALPSFGKKNKKGKKKGLFSSLGSKK